ncbi:MAG TPA: hypothetical protein VFQ87_03255 [Bradyrhizobium sp.]|jgi:hypothetical protein|nr:hypothetical protein [Bradyrhizobium sp.]
MNPTIHLGFEVGTGKPVAIPVGHMVVTGQSQQSGKTTTLEALISRSGARAVAFVTKRGEGSFGQEGRTIRPYFRERADWQFVEAIIESAMRQRMRFERAWIVRATKGATSLAEVRANVRKLQASSKRSMDQDVYMLLGEYLDLVVPLIAKLPASDHVDLAPGLNVMDLGAYPSELQALVIQSVLSWIYQHERDVIAVIPEAWEFVPQKRGSPVKLAAIDLIRKGAGLHDYLWIDSQDIAGVEKEVVRQAPVWLLGVQREENEIRRTLAHLPAGVKRPKPDDVAGLGVGQFWACWHKNAVKVYVQPAWLSAAAAEAVARGTSPVPPASWATSTRSADRRPTSADRRSTSADERPTSADRRPPLKTGDVVGGLQVVTLDELDRRLDEQPEEVDDMGKEAEAKLDRVIALLESQHRRPPPATSPAAAAGAVVDEDALYERFKARLLADAPALLRLTTIAPEIEVTRERKIIKIDGSTLRGRVAKLIADGFFAAGKSNRETVNELARTGRTAHDSNVSKELTELISMGFLYRTAGNRVQQTTEARVNVVDGAAE